MLKIKGYKKIGSFDFSSGDTGKVIKVWGEPNLKKKTRLGNIQYEYESLVFRFDQETNDFLECTILPYLNISINGIICSWDKPFLAKLCDIDGDPKVSFGFVILANIGIAVTGIHDDDEPQLAITVFSDKELDDFLDGAEDFDRSLLTCKE